ncbi:hypothetical protein [Gillisia marina]|uniref:hypothetical protein n=1 Tax=Gillisia marina TaxID=1167637 RepID=UPI00029A846E|nr:hypothetical protein [Gillisia marina]
MDNLFIILTGIIAVIATFYVSTRLNQGAVRASAGLSLTVALFTLIFPDLFSNYLLVHIPIVFLGASFVGMVSKELISNYWVLGLAGLLFSMLYLNTGSYFEGFGGALGTTASISVVLILGLKTFTKLTRIGLSSIQNKN